MQYLRADSTATVLIGPFVDYQDGVTGESGVTLSGADAAEIMKHDGTTFVDISSLTFTHKQNGMYTLALTASETDTEGRLTIFIADENVCLPVWKDFMVVPANVFDAIFLGSDALQVDAIQVGGTVQTANDMSGDVDTILSRVIGTLAAGTHNPQSGDTYSRLGAPIAASISADIQVVDGVVDGIKGVTDNLPNSGALTDIDTGVNNLETRVPDTISLANINSQVDTALADINLDHLISIAVDTNFATTVHEDSVIGEIAQRGGANLWDRSTDSLEALRNTAPIGTTMRGTDNAALASVCTEGRLSELDSGNIPADVDAILADTGTDGVVVASINANAITATAIQDGAIAQAKLGADCITAAKIADDAFSAEHFATDCLTDDALAASFAAEIFDSTGSITSLSFEALIERIYQMINNKMEVNEASGNVTLYDLDEVSTEATGNVDSASGTTTRAELSWA